jgi:hypothetical protein
MENPLKTCIYYNIQITQVLPKRENETTIFCVFQEVRHRAKKQYFDYEIPDIKPLLTYKLMNNRNMSNRVG